MFYVYGIYIVCVCVLGGWRFLCEESAGCEGVGGVPHHHDTIPD